MARCAAAPEASACSPASSSAAPAAEASCSLTGGGTWGCSWARGLRREADPTPPLRGRLVEIATETDRLVRLVARTGELESATRSRPRRREVEAQLAAVCDPFDRETLRGSLEAKLGGLRAWLADTPERAREALAALLGPRRLAVTGTPLRDPWILSAGVGAG